MRRLLLRLSPALHLTRITTAFAAVANVWFVILWTSASEPEPKPASFQQFPLWVLLLGGAVNAVGLFTYTTALNDVLDFRRDQTLHPNRPIPSGRMSLDRAVTVVVLTLATAVLGAIILGPVAVLLTLIVAGAALFFNAAGKYVPAIGLVVLGLMYAGQMVTPNLHLLFVLPVWLVMTHALAVAGIAHVFGRKAPGISARAFAFAFSGWAFWSSVMFVVGWWRNFGQGGLWPRFVNPWAWAPPVILAALFAVLVWRRVAVLGRGPRVAEKIHRYGALWLSFYACSWMFSQHYQNQAIILGVLTLVGFLGMTVLREVYALIEHPIAYRT